MIDTIEINRSQFRSISSLVKNACGIHLHDGKMALVRARLNKRLRTLGVNDFGEYLDRVLTDPAGSEMVQMLDALSTNMTYFFREPRHFDVLRDRVLPAAMARHESDRRLRIWSAGCSSGEEPYSIAITAADTLATEPVPWDIGILGTDLSTRVIGQARQGLYPKERLVGASSAVLERHFKRTSDGYQVKPAIRKLVQFAHLNLMGEWPMSGRFDAIFCRNVMIYFDKPTQERLIDRLWERLERGGTLFLGHSESLTGVRHSFRYVQPTVYEKP